MKQIPPYPTTGETAEACGCSRYKIHKLFERTGILERHGTGPFCASESAIREHLIAVHERLHYWFVDGGKEAAEQRKREKESARGSKGEQKRSDPL